MGQASRKTAWQPDETDRDKIRWTLRTINRSTTNYLEHGDWVSLSSLYFVAIAIHKMFHCLLMQCSYNISSPT